MSKFQLSPVSVDSMEAVTLLKSDRKLLLTVSVNEGGSPDDQAYVSWSPSVSRDLASNPLPDQAVLTVYEVAQDGSLAFLSCYLNRVCPMLPPCDVKLNVSDVSQLRNITVQEVQDFIDFIDQL